MRQSELIGNYKRRIRRDSSIIYFMPAPKDPIKYREWRKKISQAHQGKSYSEEYKRKMSERCKGINTWMKGSKLPKEQVKKMRESLSKYWQNSENRKVHSILLKQRIPKGKEHHLWKGGVNSENHIIRHSIEWQNWRENVFKRDDYTCQICKTKGSIQLHPHHIYKFADYPELRFSVKNGITLCVDCHNQTLRKEKDFIDMFLAKIG